MSEDVYDTLFDVVEQFEYVRREQIYFFYEAFHSCDDLDYIYDCLCDFNANLHALRNHIEYLKLRVYIAEDDTSRC